MDISLDYARNRLIKIEIYLTAATFALAIFSAVSSSLGENVPLPRALASSRWSFAAVNAFMLLLSLAVFAAIMARLSSSKLRIG